MVALEALISVLVVVVFILATAALWIGFLGVIGAVRFVRCEECGRIELAPTSVPTRACLRCRHRRLLHPVTSIHRAHAMDHDGHIERPHRVA
jgi:DNA-directed RNA polymerase subunit RPC12/RpoP